ncbi:MAG: cytidine deaminase [Bryobacteraceae bacterium]|nr:cytidine deaminase [Bryobacteraceae bacterium]
MKLAEAALAARLHAYAPHSNFLVGAAIETQDGCVFSGCNVENSSYGLTVCAERVAVFSAIAAGVAPRTFREIVVCAAPRNADAFALTPPCGACRQVLWDLCGNIPVVLWGLDGSHATYQLADLLPKAFDATHLLPPA